MVESGMPFTASHIAAVIPLSRRPLVPSALVAGSMAPDLPYFVLLYPGGSEYTHTWWGMAVVDVPIALLALLVYRVLLLEPAVALLPDAARSRVAWLPAPRFGVAMVVSALIGAATHLFFDGFTHEHHWGAELFPALHHEILSVPVYIWAQATSTLLGALIVAVWSVRKLSRMPRRPVPARFAPPRRPALVRALVALCTVVFMASTLRGYVVEDVLAGVSITAVTGTLTGLALYGLWRRARRRNGAEDRTAAEAADASRS
ncbi:DUF4184 family protein [Saccharothrix hoggarensis]|uniref:DUF4184 family protein n=1 Tax=Saccharothrix hoggarensis TaxID=913853 RepID=A0ABW3R0Q3_9PSEU